MCGIAGIVGDSDPDRIERMTASVTHRGPDSAGTKVFPKERLALGHRRLSILDLSERGAQPMSDARERYWITYNGEIYNYREVRRELERKGLQFQSGSDTEVLLASYQAWGEDCLSRLNGMFAFAIWDREERRLFAARDRLGIKPFYYHQGKNGLFLFASEIKALLASDLVSRGIDYTALHTPALYQACPLTGFEAIRKLPPGCRLPFQDGSLDVRPYWNIKPRERALPAEEAIDELDELVGRAVSRQMISDVPVGAFLSGGLDSSLIVALMARHTDQPVHSFTVRYADEDQRFEQMADDSHYARKVADHFGCIHREFTIEPDIAELLPKMVWHLDEPLSDPASINTYLISQAARENGVVVLLNGMGGDEVFGGYRSQLASLIAQRYCNLVPQPLRSLVEQGAGLLPSATSSRGIRSVRWAKRFLAMAATPGDKRHILGGMMDESLYRSLFSWEHCPEMAVWDHHHCREMLERLQRQDLSYLTRMCLADTEVYMADHNLNYSDKCTMAAGVEGRPPLIDHEVVDFMFSLPPEHRIHRTSQKHLLKKVAERYLPSEIVHRPKAPFGAPLRSWMRGALSEMVSDLLSESNLRKRGLYNPAAVRRIVQEDKEGRADNAHLIWRLLCNEVWMETFQA